MSKANRSKNHHWWPVALQQYWADRHDELSWIEPDGTKQKKKPTNRKIGYKRHGHTIFRGSGWESNFESEFDIDNEVHNIIARIRKLKPLGRTPSEFYALIKLLGKKDRTIRDMCKFYHLDEPLHRNLLLFLYSLVIRSPAGRSRYENYPGLIGLPPNEEVGKLNMVQNYRVAKKLCQNGLISNQYFVLLQSPLKKFILGDGSLDWLDNASVINHIKGRALVPLTPHICVYFCTPMVMRTTPNCASMSPAPWMVDQINEITQIYSKDKLFYLGKPPKLTDSFRQQQFLEHKDRTDVLIDMLDEIIGNRKPYGLQSIGLSGL